MASMRNSLQASAVLLLCGICAAAASVITPHAGRSLQSGLQGQVAGRKASGHHHCGTKSPSVAQQLSVENHIAAAKRMSSRSLLATTISVNVKFTIFTTVAKPSKNTSNVPDSVIVAQVAVLNKYFAPYGFQWNLTGIQRDNRPECETLNLDTFSSVGLSAIEQTFSVLETRQLAYGCLAPASSNSSAVLDVYLKDATGQDMPSGQASFPWDYTGHDIDGKGPVFDGIILPWQSLPGAVTGKAKSIKGLALVHGVGHWLALYHPWEGGCGETGDWVSDTQPQLGPNLACTPQETCGNATYSKMWEGQLGYKDDVHNLMGYNPEGCLKHFTPDQTNRMLLAWVAYRAISTAVEGETPANNCTALVAINTLEAPANGSILSVPAGFSNLQWSHWAVVNASAAAAAAAKDVTLGKGSVTEGPVNTHRLYATGYTYGSALLQNVLTNINGSTATIGLDSTAVSFSLSSFFATPVYVDTLNLTLRGSTGAGGTLQASFVITNPVRVLVVLDSKWKNLTEVAFSAQRNDFPTDADRNHAVAFDELCLSVDLGTDVNRTLSISATATAPSSSAAQPFTATLAIGLAVLTTLLFV